MPLAFSSKHSSVYRDYSLTELLVVLRAPNIIQSLFVKLYTTLLNISFIQSFD